VEAGPSAFFAARIPTDRGFCEGRCEMHSHPLSDPRLTDPPFLFVMLLAARKAGDGMLESLARDWLAEVGIRVVFADALDSPLEREGADRG
jgi:hypothetical protein